MDLCEFTLSDYIKFVINDIDNMDEDDKNSVFNNFFLIVKTLITTLKELQINNYIHSDLKGSNILIMKNQNDNYIVKISDFETIISYNEYLQVKRLNGYTEKFIPKEIIDDKNIYYQGQNLTEKQFFSLDVYSVAKLLECFFSIKKKFSSKKNYILNRFENHIIEKIIVPIEQIISLEEFEMLFESFIKEETIDFIDKKLILTPKFLISNIYEKFKDFQNEEKKEIMKKYVQIGFLDKPLKFFLCDIVKNDKQTEYSLLAVAKLYSLMKNNKKAIAYYSEYLVEVELKKIPKVEEIFLFAQCEIASTNLLLGNEGRKKAHIIADKINESLVIKNLNFHSSYIQEIMINLIYIYIETFEYEKAEIMVKKS